MANAASSDPDELERVQELLAEVAEYENGGKVLNDHYDEASYIRRRRGFLSRHPAFAASAATSDPASRDGHDVFAGQPPQLSVQKVRQRELVCEVEPLTPFPTSANTQTIDDFASYPPHEWEIGMPEMWPVPVQPDDPQYEGQVDQMQQSTTQQATATALDSTDTQPVVGTTLADQTHEKAQKTSQGLDISTSTTAVTTTVESGSTRICSSGSSVPSTQSFTPSPEQLDFMMSRLDAIGARSVPLPGSASDLTATSTPPPVSPDDRANSEIPEAKPCDNEVVMPPITHYSPPSEEVPPRSTRSSTAAPLAITTASALANRPAYGPVKPQIDKRKRKRNRDEASGEPQDNDADVYAAAEDDETHSSTKAISGRGSRGKQTAKMPATKRAKRAAATKPEAAKPTRRVAQKAPRRGRATRK